MSKIRWLYALGLAAGMAGCGVEDGAVLEQGGTSNDPIVGGTTAVITDYPWQVSFQTSSGSHFCGGSIIDAQWVLTAQHCTNGQSASGLRIVAGITKRSLSSSGQIRSIAQIIPYPGYTDASNGKDVSLLKLSSPLDLSGASAKAIPLVTAADATAGLTNAGVMATVTGWGTTSSGSSTLPDNLMQVSVPIVSNATAQSAYSGYTITADQMGAGYMGTGGKDSCQGDSGGPLVVKDASGAWKLGGVVSWGIGCADPAYPGMYARVSSFQSWIASQIGGTTPPPTTTKLTNGQTVTGLGAASGAWVNYAIDVPAGATNLVVSMSGGTGDGDLYVKFGSAPTTSSYDCRPYKSGNTESCTFAAPSAGTYYISIYGYSTFSGVSLTASYGTGGGGSGYPGVELSRTGLSGATSSWQNFTLAVPADATSLTVTISGGTGDADLYVRKGSAPTTTAYDCRPYKAGNSETCTFTTGVGGATWYIGIRGYAAYSGVTLTGDYAK